MWFILLCTCLTCAYMFLPLVKWLGCMAALCLVQYIGTEMAGPCSSSYTGGFLQAKLLQAFSYRPVGRWSGEEVIGGP